MVTFVGTQATFMDAMLNLIELEYDAVGAYQAAIDKLDDDVYIEQLSQFMDDHNEHINLLSNIVEVHDGVPPTEGGISKQWLAKGKIFIANLMGDKLILLAMSDNEKDTVKAYERMSERIDQWDDAKEIIQRGLNDEHRHKAWFDSIVYA